MAKKKEITEILSQEMDVTEQALAATEKEIKPEKADKSVSRKEFEEFKSAVIADLNALATYVWNPDLLKTKGE